MNTSGALFWQQKTPLKIKAHRYALLYSTRLERASDNKLHHKKSRSKLFCSLRKNAALMHFPIHQA